MREDSVKKRILKEKAIPKVEEFWFMTDHEHLRAAAAELLLNMLFLEEFYLETVKVSGLSSSRSPAKTAQRRHTFSLELEGVGNYYL